MSTKIINQKTIQINTLKELEKKYPDWEIQKITRKPIYKNSLWAHFRDTNEPIENKKYELIITKKIGELNE